MKVFVVAHYFPYEGFDSPEAVFSTQEAADAYCVKMQSEESYGYYEVFELELDNPNGQN